MRLLNLHRQNDGNLIYIYIYICIYSKCVFVCVYDMPVLLVQQILIR